MRTWGPDLTRLVSLEEDTPESVWCFLPPTMEIPPLSIFYTEKWKSGGSVTGSKGQRHGTRRPAGIPGLHFEPPYTPSYDSKFWKQLFIVCSLFAPGYLFYHALCWMFGVVLGGLQRLTLLMYVISSECQLAGLSQTWTMHRRPWQSRDRVVSGMRQPFAPKLILMPQMLCHLSKTSAALLIRLSFL